MRAVDVGSIYLALGSEFVAFLWVASRWSRLTQANRDSQGALSARLGNALVAANRSSSRAGREFGVASLFTALGLSLLILSPGSVFSSRDNGRWFHFLSGVLLLIGAAIWCSWCIRIVRLWKEQFTQGDRP